MRRDMTLVREVLLKVEALNIPPGPKFILRGDRGFDEDEADIRVEGSKLMMSTAILGFSWRPAS